MDYRGTGGGMTPRQYEVILRALLTLLYDNATPLALGVAKELEREMEYEAKRFDSGSY